MKKYAFIDRDGTIIFEPKDTFQVEHLSHLYFIKNVISSLKELQKMGYVIVVVSNQDGLGTSKNPLENYNKINTKILDVLYSEGIVIDEILTCPHFLSENKIISEELNCLIDKLAEKNPEMSQALRMFYFDEMQTNEISDELNVSINTIKTRLHRGRARIKSMLQEDMVLSS